jgi:transcriptional regulator
MSEIKHYGTPRHSGRYPWGSGGNAEQRNTSFLKEVQTLRKKGLTNLEIAKGMGITTSELRARQSIARTQVRTENISRAIQLKDKGYSFTEIGRLMSLNESSVRALLDPVLQQRTLMTKVTADLLKESVKNKKYIDVGLGVEHHIGVSRVRLKIALELLKDEGYNIYYLNTPQAGTGKKTSLMALTDPDTSWSEVNANKDKLVMPTEFHFKNENLPPDRLRPIINVKSSNIKINYSEDGGDQKDGLIELRRGVKDLDLGKARYAQVRIGVDGTHFLKGMAVYNDNLPEGVDIVFHTNKSKTIPKEKVFKPQTGDPINPFGAAIKAGGQKGALNIINEETDWAKWSKNLSSQVLSKQDIKLIKQQLDLSLNIKKEEFESINNLTNPVIKKKLLISFADDCDSSAEHLKAAALPRQASKVLLPFPEIKEGQVYAPTYRNGEKVVLIRHPHGGVFEIPELIVNNRIASVKKVIGTPIDAIGINPTTAAQLSGADFDGDAAIVIPTDGKTIKTSSPLKGLKNFNARESYKGYPEMKPMTKQLEGIEMGNISNLITDMSLKGANESEIARAVRHSMVVIDAEKHNLDYKKSFNDNGIAALKLKYQGRADAGASTLISKASSQVRVDARSDNYKIDPSTGKKIYYKVSEKEATYVNKKGETVSKKIISTKMAETDNAYTLSSGTLKENTYASYANQLKSLANEARKTSVNTENMVYSPSANKAYSNEVASLKAKLNIALKNAPKERQAQLLAKSMVDIQIQNNPQLKEKKDTLKKIRGRSLEEARIRVGAGKQRIDINQKEWEAIQAGAVTNNVMIQILNNTDMDRIKTYATPREESILSPAKVSKAMAMEKAGYTQADIADALGISTDKLIKALS